MKQIFFLPSLFLFVFGISLNGIIFNSSKIIILLLTLVYPFVNMGRITFYNNNKIFYIGIILITLLFFSILYPFLHNTNDYSVAYKYLIILVEALYGAYLLYVLFFKKYSIDDVLHFIIVITFIQAMIIIVMFISESFREIIFSLSQIDQASLMLRYTGGRGFGLASSITYDLSIFQSISLMFISYLLTKYSNKKAFYFIAWLAIFFSVLFLGRSGWFGIFLSIIIIIFNSRKYIFKNITFFVVANALFIYLALFSLKYFYPDKYDIFIFVVFPHAFEMFINFIETGIFRTGSSDSVNAMWFSVSKSTFLLGDGFFRNPYGQGHYMHTDVGYMRHILFYGIIPSTLLYSFYILGFSYIYNYFKWNKTGHFLILLLAIYYFVGHYKGDFLTGSGMNIKLFFIILIYTIFQKKYYLH